VVDRRPVTARARVRSSLGPPLPLRLIGRIPDFESGDAGSNPAGGTNICALIHAPRLSAHPTWCCRSGTQFGWTAERQGMFAAVRHAGSTTRQTKCAACDANTARRICRSARSGIAPDGKQAADMCAPRTRRRNVYEKSVFLPMSRIKKPSSGPAGVDELGFLAGVSGGLHGRPPEGLSDQAIAVFLARPQDGSVIRCVWQATTSLDANRRPRYQRRHELAPYSHPANLAMANDHPLRWSRRRR
jgi:hypothetical protein